MIPIEMFARKKEMYARKRTMANPDGLQCGKVHYFESPGIVSDSRVRDSEPFSVSLLWHWPVATAMQVTFMAVHYRA